MATKKQSLTAEQAFKGALVNLAQLGFEVQLEREGTVARIKHPLAARYEHVDQTKVLYSSYKDRVEVDGKRVALGEIISRAVEASLRDVEQAQKQVEHTAKLAVKKGERYEALLAAGVDKAARGMAFGKKYATTADRLVAKSENLDIVLEPGDRDETIVLTITAKNGSLGALAKALTAARKGLTA
jgi:ribosomal protein S18 acetylase RimI-like enzyme